MLKIKPILFNTEMVKAILAGQKTQTRRVVKKRGVDIDYLPYWSKLQADSTSLFFDVCRSGTKPSARNSTAMSIKLPYCVGDILYVRETTYYDSYAAFSKNTFYKADYEQKPDWVARVVPSIHMQKEDARIFLKVTKVRVEKLQNISSEDCKSEGIYNIEFFKNLWNSTIKKQDLNCYGWEADPYVWVIEFERCEKPKE